MAADGAIRFEISLDLGKLKTEIADASKKINDKFTGAFSKMGKRCQESCNQAGKEFQKMSGEVDEARKKIDAILADQTKSMKAKAASISWIYRKQGMEQSEAMKKAWTEIERSSDSGSEHVKKNIKGIGNQSKQTSKEISSGLGSALKKIGTMLISAFAVKKLADFGKECIELGSDLAEVQNVVDVVFPHMNKQIDSFAKNAAAQFGLSETMAKKFTGTFGAMSKAFGFNEKAAYDMSTTLTGLAGDVASFYNISQDEAYTKLKSVFTGETESLKDLGVVMTQTALDSYAMANGFGKTTAKMSEMEKVALRYQFVQDQLTSAVGDFSRTSDGWANQVRILKLQFDSLKATIGQGLINVLSPVIKVINTIIGKLMTLANAFKSFTELLSGKKGSGGAASGMVDVAAAAGKAENATSGVGDAAKKTAKELKGITTGIDELNIIDQSTDSSSGSGSGGGYSSDSFDMGSLADTSALDETDSKMQALIDRMKELTALATKGFWDGFGDTSVFQSIKSELGGIKESLKNIFLAQEVQTAANKFADSVAYNLGKTAGSAASIGATIADNVLGGMDLYLGQNSGRIKTYLVSMFDIGSDIATISGNFNAAVAEIFSVFRSDSDKQITADIIGIFNDSFMGVTELAGKFARDIINVIATPITDNAGQIKDRIQGVLDELQPKFDKLKELIDHLWDGLNTAYDTIAKPVFDAFTEAISSAVDWITETQDRFDGAVTAVTAFFAAWEVIKLGEFIINAGGVVAMLSGMASGFTANVVAIGTHIAALVADKVETAAIVAMYAKDFVVNLAQGTAALVTQAAQFALNTAAKIADTVAQAAMTAATVAWNAVCAIATTVTAALGAAIAFLTSPIGLVVLAIAALIAAGVLLYKHWDTVKAQASAIWNGIKSVIDTVVRAIQTGINTTIGKIQNSWKNTWTSVKNTTSQIFNDMWAAIKSTINAILSGVESMANGVVRAINKMVDALNNLHFDIPDWVPGLGGKSFGLNIPHIPTVSIPRLAQGGFVRANTPQLAMIGDNRHQGEIVAPEDKMQAMVDRAVAMASNQNMTDQYLLMMIDLLKRIIEVIQALDLTVNIDIRDIKNKLKQLEDRSGYPLRG